MSTATRPTRGTVWLVLLPSTERLGLYLELPLAEMPQFTKRPLKYLRYLAFVILGQDGTVSSEENNATGDNDSLVDGAIYVFRPNDGQEFQPERMVNRQVFARGASTSSREAQSRLSSGSVEFMEQLFERDVDDIFALAPSLDLDWELCQGAHIIPHAKGDEWLQIIMSNRPVEDDYSLAPLSDIDDIRNGFMTDISMNILMDNQRCSVLVTPNRILDPDDVPERIERPLRPEVSYPTEFRFTRQTFGISALCPSNVDAAFTINSDNADLPSVTLLQYHYGACAMKRWGRNIDTVDSSKLHHPIDRPSPSRIGRQPHGIRDRSITLEKQEDSSAAPQSSSKRRKTSAGKRDEGPDMFDIVLALSSGSATARENRARHEQELAEFSSSMRDWAENVEPGSGM